MTLLANDSSERQRDNLIVLLQIDVRLRFNAILSAPTDSTCELGEGGMSSFTGKRVYVGNLAYSIAWQDLKDVCVAVCASYLESQILYAHSCSTRLVQSNMLTFLKTILVAQRDVGTFALVSHLMKNRSWNKRDAKMVEL